MKEWIAKYQKAIVGTGAVAVLILCYFQQKELARLRQYENGIQIYSPEHGKDVRLSIEDIQKVNELYKLESDSLKSEDFVKSTIITRYEVALELFREKNKKGADEFELILSTQTE